MQIEDVVILWDEDRPEYQHMLDQRMNVIEISEDIADHSEFKEATDTFVHCIAIETGEHWEGNPSHLLHTVQQ